MSYFFVVVVLFLAFTIALSGEFLARTHWDGGALGFEFDGDWRQGDASSCVLVWNGCWKSLLACECQSWSVAANGHFEQQSQL
jgi:hypothetical protein